MRWWLRLRFLEGAWIIQDQTTDEAVMRAWDDDIDAREERTGIDHEFISTVISLPYSARSVAESIREAEALDMAKRRG